MFHLNPQIKVFTIDSCGEYFTKSTLKAASPYLTSLEFLATSIDGPNLTKCYKELASIQFKTVTNLMFGVSCERNFSTVPLGDYAMILMSFDRLESFKFIYDGHQTRSILDEVHLFTSKHPELPGFSICKGYQI